MQADLDSSGTLANMQEQVLGILIGLVVTMGCLLGGFIAMGGHVGVLMQPWEFVIIGGSARHFPGGQSLLGSQGFRSRLHGGIHQQGAKAA